MRRLSANYIFPVNTAPLKNGIVEIDENGKIQNIIDTKGELKETRNLEFYNGVIIPGFINTHCHLELSELKNIFKQKIGLAAFLEEIVKFKRIKKTANTEKAIELYDDLMRKNGIVAVGDIANTDNTISTKKRSR
ncbi:amidohydrolase, partial [Bacteroidota bacterium]